MTEIDSWLERYDSTHNSLRNPVLYWASLPLAVVGLTGVLWALPVPAEFVEISPLLNWGSAFLMAAAIYYFIISLSLAIGLLPFLLGLASIQLWLASAGLPAMMIMSGLLLLGLIGLVAGRSESLRAAAQDLQLLMIGPAWLLSRIYQRFGIPI